MNLQIVSPYRKCPYKCPFCVAGIEKHSIFSDELYNTNKVEYFEKLYSVIRHEHIQTVILTGDTEPTLFPKWIKEVVGLLDGFVQIELQTRNYKYKGMNGIDVLAYSLSSIPTFELPKNPYGLTREVFIYNTDLSIIQIAIHFQESKHINQCTVKQMMYNEYGNEKINKYITEHQKRITNFDIETMKDFKIKYDANCTDSKDRYLIFRTDGKVYEKWSDMPQ